MTPRVGLVTVLYNSPEVLPGFFESLAAQDYAPYWLYIIDNSPTEISLNLATELAKKYSMVNLTLIRNTANVGVAAANNQGIKLSLDAGCEYVLLLNNDIEFEDPRLLSRMVEMADQNGEDMVVPKIHYYDTGLIWCAGGGINQWKGTAWHIGDGQKETIEFQSDQYTQYAPTCFMLIRCEVFAKIGLMDEKYFVYYDDVDFVWRANKAGFRIRYWADSKVEHKVSSSTGGSESEFSIYYGTRNRIYFVLKQFRFYQRLVSITYLLFTRLIKLVRYNQRQRTKMLAALRDGFAMHADSA